MKAEPGPGPRAIHEQLDRVLDDWAQGLQDLRGAFLQGSHSSAGLLSAAIHFPADAPRPISQPQEVRLDATKGRQPICALVQLGPYITWHHVFFGESKVADLNRYMRLAESAFAHVRNRPGNAILRPVRLEIGYPAMFWTSLVHMFAMDLPTANLNCRQRAYVPENYDTRRWESSIADQLLMSMSSRQERSGYGTWEATKKVGFAYSLAHYSVLNHDVFLSSAFAIDLLLRDLHEVEGDGRRARPSRAKFSQTEELCLKTLYEMGMRSLADLRETRKENRPTAAFIVDHLFRSERSHKDEATVRAALSSLVKRKFAQNGRYIGLAHGYCLTDLGVAEARRPGRISPV